MAHLVFYVALVAVGFGLGRVHNRARFQAEVAKAAAETVANAKKL